METLIAIIHLTVQLLGWNVSTTIDADSNLSTTSSTLSEAKIDPNGGIRLGDRLLER